MWPGSICTRSTPRRNRPTTIVTAQLDTLLGLVCHSHHVFRHRSDVQLIGTWDDLWPRMPDGTLLACPTKRQPLFAAA